MTFYPKISDETLSQFETVFSLMKNEPGYLDAPECILTDRAKNFFRNLAAGSSSIETGNIFDEGKPKIESIENQIGSLLFSLDQLAQIMGNKDVAEKLSYFKTKTTLIEKLVSIQERIFNIKEMAEFQDTYMQFMEDICTKDQVGQLLSRLSHLNSIDKD